MSRNLIRRAGRGTLAAARRPAEWVIAALVLAPLFLPVRVPDLRRFTRSDRFCELQTAAAAWLSQNRELIERGAPWLDRTGCWVYDRCETSGESHALASRGALRLHCTREIIVVYGLDGDLPAVLSELAALLAAAGWRGSTIPSQPTPQVPPFWGLSWSPGGRVRVPGVLETIPPDRRLKLTAEMRVTWLSRGESAERVTLALGTPPRDPHTASAIHQPVEIRGDDVIRLAAQALAWHDHLIAIQVPLCYYLNANVNARPHRLRKRPLPVLRARSA